MDVAADHAVDAGAPRLAGQRLFERADEIHRVLHLQLGPLRQRPIGNAEQPPQRVDEAIELDRKVIGLVAEMREPARVLHHEVEDVAVNDEIVLAVRGFVDGVLDHLDAAEMGAVIVAQEFVVIAGDVDDARALARLAQHLLHKIIVGLRPVPAGFQRPAIDDVADQIDRLGIVGAEKIQQPVGLRAAGAQVDIGDEQGPKAPFRTAFAGRAAFHARASIKAR